MNVHRLHPATADGHLTALAWGRADLKRPEAGLRETTATNEHSGSGARYVFEEVSAI
jgi:hypothetical protein